MCCKIPYKRYIFAVQITMQRKVDFLRKFYVDCNETKNQTSYIQKTEKKETKQLKSRRTKS